MNDAFEGLSPRARAYLATVGCTRTGPVASRAQIAAMFTPALDDALLARLVEFEARYGGVVIDAAARNLELGLGALAGRNIAAERLVEPADLVVVGIEADADILLDVRGWLWASAADDAGEQAVSVQQYFERLAATAHAPWPGTPYMLILEPRIDDVVRAFDLTVDALASDDVFTVAGADVVQLRAQRRGTEWLTSRIKLLCRDFSALHHALSVLHAKLPELRAAIASGHPSWQASRVQRKDASSPDALEADLATHSVARIGSLAPGGAIHLLRDGGIEAYTVAENGGLRNHHQITSAGGRYRELYGPLA